MRAVAGLINLCALHRHQLRKSLSVDINLNPNLSQRKDSNDFELSRLSWFKGHARSIALSMSLEN